MSITNTWNVVAMDCYPQADKITTLTPLWEK